MPMNARCAKTAKSTGIRREIEPGLGTRERQNESVFCATSTVAKRAKSSKRRTPSVEPHLSGTDHAFVYSVSR